MEGREILCRNWARDVTHVIPHTKYIFSMTWKATALMRLNVLPSSGVLVYYNQLASFFCFVFFKRSWAHMIVFTNTWMHGFILHVIHSKSVSAAWWLNSYSSKCFLQSPWQLGLGSGRGSSGACRRTAPIAGPPWVLGCLWSSPAATAYLRRNTTGAKWTYLRQGATQIQLTCLPPAFVTKRSVDWEWRDWQVLLLFFCCLD